MSIQELTRQLRSYIESHHPLIYVDTFEDTKADEIIKEVGNTRNIIEWNFSSGIVDFNTKRTLEDGKTPNLAAALEKFRIMLDDEKERIIVLKDAHHFIHNPDVLAKLRSLIAKIKNSDVCAWILIVSPVVDIPLEIEKYATVCELTLPDIDEISAMVTEFVTAQDDKTAEEDIEDLSLSLKGLSRHEIEMLLYLSFQQSGHISKKSKETVLAIKEQVIRKSNIIEMIPLKEKISDIGGLSKLKNWLEKKSKIFNDLIAAQKYGIETPKGVMIMGMPGCGKSLSAKAAAHLFGVPLLRLDIGKLMGKYLGESEANMRRAIKVAEAISPCVLWIDEIEKSFGGMSSGGEAHEVTTRLLGTFLTWMQEKTAPVFVIATANNIQNLPPEMMRKGRFDELFFIDFPNDDERKAVFKIHLEKRKHNHSDLDIAKLVAKTAGYCGADIESVIKEGIETRYLTDKSKKVQTTDILDAINETVPLKEMLKDKIEKMQKRVDDMKIKPAS